MNTLLKQRLDEKLEHLSERQFAEVLDFVELLEARERSAVAALSEAHDEDTYLIGVEKTLDEGYSQADEQAFETPSQRIEAALALMREIIQSPPKGRLGPPFLDLTGFQFNRDEANER